MQLKSKELFHIIGILEKNSFFATPGISLLCLILLLIHYRLLTLADLWSADPNFPSEMYCSTPLIRAATCEVAYAARSAAISYALLRAGACPSATNSCREHVIMSVARLRREDVVGALLDTFAQSPHAFC